MVFYPQYGYLDNNQVTKSFPTLKKTGERNPLDIPTIRQILNINTKFRENYNNTIATDFIHKLPDSIKKAISMKILSYDIPDTNYNISNYYRNNQFTVIRDNSSFLIEVPDGMYSFENSDELTTQINEQFVDDISDLNISIDSLTLKTTIKYDASNSPIFLDFNYKDISCNDTIYSSSFISKPTNNVLKQQLTLGWLLGYRGNYIKPLPEKLYNNNIKPSYTPFHNYNYGNGKNKCDITINKDYSDISFTLTDPILFDNSFEFISDGIVDFNQSNHFFLYIDDYQNNSKNIYLTNYTNQCVNSNNIICKLSDNLTLLLDQPNRVYFGPTDIDKLHIKIVDIYGRVANLNHNDFSIELLIESIYE